MGPPLRTRKGEHEEAALASTAPAGDDLVPAPFQLLITLRLRFPKPHQALLILCSSLSPPPATEFPNVLLGPAQTLLFIKSPRGRALA